VPIAAVPLQAHALLGDAQSVSLLYFMVSIGGLLGSLAIPWLAGRIQRRWVFTLGAALVAVSCALYVAETRITLALGLMAQILGAACIEITLNLYVLDHVRRRDLGRFEPRRVFVAAGAWTLGPWLGVTLKTHVGAWAAYGLAGAAALALLACFWFLRVTDNPALPRGRTAPPNPIRYLPRFFAQPRLRLAWLLAVGRAGWWGMFFIFAPIYAVTAGLGAEVGGAIVSIGLASLFLVPLWGRLGRRIGLRRLLIAGYAATGLATMAVAPASSWPWLGAALLVIAAVAASILDGAGNTPFLRAVRPLERPEMTTVYGSFRHTAQLVPPGVFAALLRAFALPSVFVAGGGFLVVLAWIARYIPKRM
jgi:MFS transporter, ACDE family, multidrug resistance protein